MTSKLLTTVKLNHASPLFLAANAARTCWDSNDKSDTLKQLQCTNCLSTDIDTTAMECEECGGSSFENHLGERDEALLERVIGKFKHGSIAEHITINISVKRMPRSVLQEISRHRIGVSPSVASSRYILKKIMKGLKQEDYSKYFMYIGDEVVDSLLEQQITTLITAVKTGKSNDVIKHLLPEAMYADGVYTFNLRAVHAFLNLRIADGVYPPIQYLASRIYDSIPESYRFLTPINEQYYLPANKLN